MKPELNLLVWAVAVTVVQVLVALTGAFNQVGLMKLVGKREGMPEITGWGGRAERAHLNMVQNLVLFAALVLVAVAAGETKDVAPLRGPIVLWFRGGFAGVYLGGVAWFRGLAWVAFVVGLVVSF